MTGISTAQRVSAFGRVAARQMGRSRWVRAAGSALSLTVRSAARVLHLLWLQITGVFFLAFGMIGSVAFLREYHAWTAGKMGPERALLALAFSIIFFYFGVSSFWRAARRC